MRLIDGVNQAQEHAEGMKRLKRGVWVRILVIIACIALVVAVVSVLKANYEEIDREIWYAVTGQ